MTKQLLLQTPHMAQSLGQSRPGCRWYVVQTHPHGERRAQEHLQRQQFVAYLPCYSRRRKHARKVEIVQAPLFPRYLFVAVDLDVQRWLSIRSTVGVSRLVGHGDTPAPVPPGLVESLKARHGEDGLIRLAAPPGLRVGDRVRVRGGAFENNLGLFETIKDDERVTILLDLLGRQVRVTIGVEMIAAA